MSPDNHYLGLPERESDGLISRMPRTVAFNLRVFTDRKSEIEESPILTASSDRVANGRRARKNGGCARKGVRFGCIDFFFGSVCVWGSFNG